MSRFLLARDRFEAARRLHRLPPQAPEHGLHGHGFEACVQVPHAHADAAYADALPRLRERLALAMSPLRHVDLNRVLEHPDDAALAAWLCERVGDVAHLELHSTPTRGVAGQPRAGFATLRRYRFQAAHFLPNVPAGHKCGRMHGHGFEVELRADATDAGVLDAHWQSLAERLDHTLLNDVEGLANPTSEMLAAWIHERLRPKLPTLRSVSVFETGSSGARYDGDAFLIWKEFGLDSAVRVRRAAPGSPQARLHGQTFRLRLSLSAPLHEVLGWVVDFGDVKTLFRPLFERLDHQPLYEIEGLADTDTASLAAWILEACRAQLPQLCGVRLLEADGCGAEMLLDGAPRQAAPAP
ncbi:MAG: 6-carboxytetrahydropterin synthase [Betaproteobacteria bacterium]|nr:6-carboxytetrahydropterin synthase [Betaproteobacteria bacterium]